MDKPKDPKKAAAGRKGGRVSSEAKRVAAQRNGKVGGLIGGSKGGKIGGSKGGKIGGKSTSEAKAKAARSNGAKGGRPKKTPPMGSG